MQATLGDFLKRSERQKQDGIEVIDKVCKQLQKNGIKAWKLDDTYWGMGLRIGDRVLNVELIQFKDYKQDVKRQVGQMQYPSFTMKVSMQTMDSLCQLHLDPQGAAQYLADSFKEGLLQEFKKHKEVK